ncbi:MAG: triosephosphate isomerase (TIM) [Verrucomicrobia bacterium]|nr:MAG: triosephosphate isomerase (TIM) [Verrucomicrobiota bacterium]
MSTRRPIVAANWKMNKTRPETAEFLRAFLPMFGTACASDVVVVPPFTSIPKAAEFLQGHPLVGLGAQNLHPKPNGAFTGEVGAPFLVELGVTHVVLGHSERRQYFAETDSFINEKVLATLAAGLTPILCIGETLEQRDAGLLQTVCRTQLQGGLAGLGADQAAKVVVAYEPVWAIGTGRTASPAQAQEAHAFVRSVLADLFGSALAQQIRIQYGGSMKPDNAVELMAQPDVDGGLIGGASLQPDTFFAIVKAAADSVGRE